MKAKESRRYKQDAEIKTVLSKTTDNGEFWKEKESNEYQNVQRIQEICRKTHNQMDSKNLL